MNKDSIAKQVLELSDKQGMLTLPEGVTGKIFTFYKDGKPCQNAIVFSDGSELTIKGKTIAFSHQDEWKKEEITTPVQPI